jgi:hypothetical protein
MLRFENHKELELTDGGPEYPAIIGPGLLGNPAGRPRLNCAPPAVGCPLSPLRRLTAQLNGCFSEPNLISHPPLQREVVSTCSNLVPV